MRRDAVERERGESGSVSTGELRAIFERLPQAVLIGDDERRIVDANAAALALLAVDRAQLIGRRIDQLTAPAASEALQANWSALLATGHLDGEMVLHLPGDRRLRIAFRAVANAAPGRHAFALHRTAAPGDYRHAQRLEEQARIHAARLKSLAEASRAFSEAGAGLRPVLEAVARKISETFGTGAGVGLGTRTGRGLVMRKVHHPDPAALAALRAARVPGSGPAVEQVLQKGQSIVVGIPARRSGAAAARALMLAPLRGQQGIIGLVWVSRERPDPPFSPRDLALLEELAERATLAIENARALTKARRTTERTLLLQAVTAAIAEPLTPAAVAAVVLRQARENLGAASAVLYGLDDEARMLRLIGADGQVTARLDGMRTVALDAPLPAAEAVRTREPVLIGNRAERVRRFPAVDWKIVEGDAAAAIPLPLGDRVVGVLGLTFNEDRPWKNDDVAFLTALARHTAQALERARLFERAQEARRAAEEAVGNKDQSLALLDTLLVSAPVGLGFLDRQLRYRRINHVLAALSATTREAYLGRTVREMIPQCADLLEPLLTGVLQTGVPVIDYELRVPVPGTPGEIRHFLASYYPVRVDEDPQSPIVGIGMVVVETTAQKRSAQTLALLAEASNILNSSLDYERTLESLTRLVVPRLGDWCAVDIIERGEARLVAVAHVDPAKVELAREIRRRYPPLPHEANGPFDVAKRRQSVLIPEVTEEMLVAGTRDAEHLRIARELGLRAGIIVPLVAGGRGFGALTLVSAESNRRYGPADLAVVEELAHRAALAVENARLYADAQDAIRVREEFLSIAGHELKTPLTALKLQLSGLARLAQRPGEIDKAAAAGRLEGTLRQAERLEKLVNQLLDVSRIAAGRLTLDREEHDLAAVVREVSARFSEEAARSGSALLVDVPAPVIGRWDRLRLEQVVSNLISNAIKYGRGQPIEVAARADGADAALLEVRDHGIGIPNESRDRIFGRFERAVPERHYGGFGLGLWIVRQVIEAHGGTITVDSAPDQGSRFLVRLPRGERPPGAA